MTGLFVLLITLASLWCGSVVIKLNGDPSLGGEHPRRPRTRSRGALLLRWRLLAHVLCNGCRVVAAEHLDCRTCQYGSICKDGYFHPKA
jgi:hypothetical protein